MQQTADRSNSFQFGAGGEWVCRWHNSAERPMACNADEHSETDERTNQAGASITDKRQRDSFIWQTAGHDANINQGLNSDQKCNA
jgi:hypothetical protein